MDGMTGTLLDWPAVEAFLGERFRAGVIEEPRGTACFRFFVGFGVPGSTEGMAGLTGVGVGVGAGVDSDTLVERFRGVFGGVGGSDPKAGLAR